MKAEAQASNPLGRMDELAREIQRLLDEIDDIFGIGP
jgi:hypothetical protein